MRGAGGAAPRSQLTLSFAMDAFYSYNRRMEKIKAFEQDVAQWVEWFKEELGEPRFRAEQLCRWLWQKRVYDFEEMTDFSKELRAKLSERVDIALPACADEKKSRVDDVRKYLWRFGDGECVESVFIKQKTHSTACVSTQAGCPLDCAFCATGQGGFARNLTAGEIAAQFLAMEHVRGREIQNLVMMGMGEPFLNTEAVLKAVRMLNAPKMRNLGIRHITISTAGVVPGIQELAASGLGVRLAVSLHFATDEARDRFMPVNHTYPLAELFEALHEYQRATQDRISIEDTLLGGINDSIEDARALVRRLRGLHCYVNLIPANPVGRFERSGAQAVLEFQKVLVSAGFETELRSERGADILAACGQLRASKGDG